MRILRVRRGFQADHSSSSYLFYAVDRAVGPKGQQVAHRYSSRAEVDDRTARYLKWGDSSISSGAYKTLLSEHYDVMASESYGWWTLMIAVPKTPTTETALAHFEDARGGDDLGVDLEDYGKRLVAVVYCQFQDDGVEFGGDEENPLDSLVDLLAKVRAEIIGGNTSFLQAVATFYGAGEDEDEEDEADESRPRSDLRDDMTKADLEQECATRGVECRKSWTKARLRQELERASQATPRSKPKRAGKPAKLSKAAREIVAQLERL